MPTGFQGDSHRTAPNTKALVSLSTKALLLTGAPTSHGDREPKVTRDSYDTDI
jgi:hypothetical protein